VQRHQASQLISSANLSLEEIQAAREENQQRLKMLEEAYVARREGRPYQTIQPEPSATIKHDEFTFGSPQK